MNRNALDLDTFNKFKDFQFQKKEIGSRKCRKTKAQSTPDNSIFQ